MGVSGSGFFHWRGRPLSARAVRRAWLADVVAEIWERSRRTYGWRRIQAELAEVHDHVANKKLLRAVMREQHISGLPRRNDGLPGDLIADRPVNSCIHPAGLPITHPHHRGVATTN